MFNIITIVSAFLLLHSVNSQILDLKKCETIPPLPTFDLTQFFGNWYEAERYPSFSQVPSACISTNFGLNKNNGTVLVAVTETPILGASYKYYGSASILQALNGQFDVIYTSGPFKEMVYAIIGTDYTNYAVLYSGSNFLDFGCFESLWILTRQRNPDKSVLDNAHAVISGKLSTTWLFNTIQSPPCCN